MLAQIATLPADQQAEISPEWLNAVRSAADDDPWMFGFSIQETATGEAIGMCGFKAPPVGGMVEIAYGVFPPWEGKGYATEAAAAMIDAARASGQVRILRAHTAATPNASTRVLQKNGFQLLGPVMDPEDGEVWRWERSEEPGPAGRA